MTRDKFLKEIKKIFVGYNFNLADDYDDEDSKSIFATKSVKTKEYRDKDKNLIHAGNTRDLFISGIMYKEKPLKDRFIYMIIYTKGEIRSYRCKHFRSIEIDKIYLAEPNYKELLEKIKLLSLCEK